MFLPSTAPHCFNTYRLTSKPSFPKPEAFRFGGVQSHIEVDEWVTPSTSPYDVLCGFVEGRYHTVDRLLKDAVREENYLGEGEESIAYDLSPAYVLLKSKTIDAKRSGKALCPLRMLLPEENIGQAIAEIGDADGEPAYTIVLKQSGMRLKQYRSALLYKNGPAPEGQVQRYTRDLSRIRPMHAEYREYIDAVASIDPRGYENMARLLLKIRNTPGLAFDPDSTNVLPDKEHDSFNLIDCQNNYTRRYENLYGMLRALLNAKLVGVDGKAERGSGDGVSLKKDPELVKKRRKILRCCIIAAYKTGLPAGREPGHSRLFPWSHEIDMCEMAGLRGQWDKIERLLKKDLRPVPFYQELDWILSQSPVSESFQNRLSKIILPPRWPCAGATYTRDGFEFM